MRVSVLVLFAGSVIAAGMFALGATGAASSDKPSADPFATMVKVLNHPRCMNCHTTVDWPTVGDDQRRHPLNVARGKDDRGGAGLLCTTCHQSKNQDAAGIPGAPNWHLAAKSMGWTGLTPGALCRALLDPGKNGGRTGEAVIEHLRADPLVLWAWTPGGKRAAPPVAHDAFVAAAEAWVKKGAPCPTP